MCKYVAYLIDSLNDDATISSLLNPVKRIQTLMEKHRKELDTQLKMDFDKK
jgi:ribose-phosphate pyrophosphokinase